MFDGFEHRPGYGKDDILFIEMNGGRWVYLNLGMGNHLYLREDFYHDIGNQILDTEYPKRYRKWMNLIGEF